MNKYLKAHQIVAAALLAVGTSMAARAGSAQDAPVLLLLDSNAVAAEQAPNLFTPADVNASVAGIGVREPMRFFMQNVNQTVVLPGGPAGHEGWFFLGSTPAGWASDPSLNDAPQNFLLAGPGLGSPDEEGGRTSLLANVAGITPLGVTNFQLLAGHSVCAVVFTNELPWSSDGTSLEGPTSGVVAFSILNAENGSDGVLEVSIRILNFANTCGDALTLMSF